MCGRAKAGTQAEGGGAAGSVQRQEDSRRFLPPCLSPPPDVTPNTPPLLVPTPAPTRTETSGPFPPRCLLSRDQMVKTRPGERRRRMLLPSATVWMPLPYQGVPQAAFPFSRSVVSNSATPRTAEHQASLSITSSLSLLKPTSIKSLMDHFIQPSHPLTSPSPPTFNLSQHQGLFQRVSSLHQVAKVLELQHQSIQRIFRTDFL